MIEVRIREAGDATSTHLMNWPDPTDLDGVIRVLTEWGVRTDDGAQYAGLSSFSGSIVIDGSRAFFEVTAEIVE
jgi:hypothetical protein